MKKKKKRIDQLVFEKGVAESREEAQRLILARKIKADDVFVTKPGMKISIDSKIEVLKSEEFVGKGARKIKSAYKNFYLNFKSKIVADVGASTGGFTDFALKKGAKKVYAIDVGYGQLAYSLRKNARVSNMERTDIRAIESFEDKIDIFLIDVSFISLKKILPKIKELIEGQSQKAEIVALVKPQFEVGKEIADRYKGVIKDITIQKKIVKEIENFALGEGFAVISQVKAGVTGEKGNQEYFLYLRYPKTAIAFGTFDLLHEGHKYFLSEVAKQGELEIIIPDDKRVYKLKERKPIHPLSQRIRNLKKLGFKVEVEKENPWQNVLESKADVIVLGYDQNWQEEIKKEIKKTGYLVKVKKIKKALSPNVHKTKIIRKRFD